MATPKRNSVTDGATAPTTTYQAAAPVDELYEQLKTQFGTVHVLEIDGEDGQPIRSYLRKLTFDVRRDVLAAIMKTTEDLESLQKDIKTLSIVGDIILGRCYVGGANFLLEDEYHLEASLLAASLVDMNSSMRLKKN